MDTMSYKGFKAQIMEAMRLTGEGVHGLPPGSALEVFPVDAFVKAPENWMKGPGVFVVPVRPNKGLWFNWRMNSEVNTAVVPTVKGCNPVTGLQTTGFHLEKYENKCPKHGVKFMAERYCPECKYNWPDRNYISMSPLWWDGFRAEDGTVRQFFFTEDELRDIATHMIGKENTVPAFGFAFYTPKEPRPEATIRAYSAGIVSHQVHPDGMMLLADGNESGLYFMNDGNKSVNFTGPVTPTSTSIYHSSLSYTGSADTDGIKLCTSNSAPIPCAAAPVEMEHLSKGTIKSMAKSLQSTKRARKEYGKLQLDSAHEYSCNEISTISLEESRAKRRIPAVVKEVSVGAGAKILQELPQDSYGLDTWKDVPDSTMTVYFVFEEKFKELQAGGMRSFKDVPEGMLAGLPVG